MTTKQRIELLAQGINTYNQLREEFGTRVSHEGTEHERNLCQLQLEELAKYGKQKLEEEDNVKFQEAGL